MSEGVGGFQRRSVAVVMAAEGGLTELALSLGSSIHELELLMQFTLALLGLIQ